MCTLLGLTGKSSLSTNEIQCLSLSFNEINYLTPTYHFGFNFTHYHPQNPILQSLELQLNPGGLFQHWGFLEIPLLPPYLTHEKTITD